MSLPRLTTPKQLSRFRRLLIVSLVLIQPLTIITILFLSHFSNERVLVEQAQKILNTATKESAEHTKAFLNTAERAIAATSLMFESQVLGADEQQRVEQYFVNVLDSNDNLAGIYFASTDGHFNFVSRSQESNLPYRVKYIDGAEKGAYTWWRGMQAQRANELFDAGDDFDPRSRPWFRLAATTGEQIWSNPYIFFTAQTLGITLAAPVKTARGELLGVIGVDVELGALTSFLERLDVSESGAAFITSSDGVLVAAPFLGEPAQLASTVVSIRELQTIETTTDAAGQRALITVRDADRHQTRSNRFEVGNIEYLVDHQKLALSGGDHWLIGTFAAKNDFLQTIRANERNNVIIALAVLVISMLIGWQLAGSAWTPVVALHDQANRDQLTNLRNRRYLQRRAGQLFREAALEQKPITVVIVDIDHFKKINDTYGHAVGDEVICAVADRLRRAARIDDTVARLGGEEFVIVLPTANISVAEHQAKKIQQWFRDEPIETSGGRIPVTFSAGIASPSPGCDTFEEVLSKADGALYQAKASGRNRIVVFSGPGAEANVQSEESARAVNA